jgi:hypothetical protein
MCAPGSTTIRASVSAFDQSPRHQTIGRIIKAAAQAAIGTWTRKDDRFCYKVHGAGRRQPESELRMLERSPKGCGRFPSGIVQIGRAFDRLRGFTDLVFDREGGANRPQQRHHRFLFELILNAKV